MQRHCYQNHKHIREVLTSRYGFRYEGIGDNGEECFRKDSATPETIFVHPLFCSYYMAASNFWHADRLHCFEVKTGFHNQTKQCLAFDALLLHLDKVTTKQSRRDIVLNELKELEKRRQRLVNMSLDPTLHPEKKESLPDRYDKVLTQQYQLITEL